MKRVGRVDIPQEAFLAVLKVAGTPPTNNQDSRREVAREIAGLTVYTRGRVLVDEL